MGRGGEGEGGEGEGEDGVGRKGGREVQWEYEDRGGGGQFANLFNGVPGPEEFCNVLTSLSWRREGGGEGGRREEGREEGREGKKGEKRSLHNSSLVKTYREVGCDRLCKLVQCALL